MLRQSLIYLLLSILVIIFANYIQILIVYIDWLYVYANLQLSPLFNQIGLGNYVSKIIILVIVPALLAAIPALLYRLIKGRDMPHFIALTWCLWLVIVLSKILIH